MIDERLKTAREAFELASCDHFEACIRRMVGDPRLPIRTLRRGMRDALAALRRMERHVYGGRQGAAQERARQAAEPGEAQVRAAYECAIGDLGDP